MFHTQIEEAFGQKLRFCRYVGGNFLSDNLEEGKRLNEQEKKMKEIDWDKLDWQEYLCDCHHGGSTAPTMRDKTKRDK